MKIAFAKQALAATLLLVTLPLCGQTAPAKPAAPAPTVPQPWKKIPIPPLHAFKPEQPKKIELANGLTIFLQEDHELPFINGSILIRGGSRDEAAAKAGLVSLYGETWRTSGTATIDGDKLDDQLESKAASIETGGGTASTSVSWSSLKGDFDSVFASAIDLLMHPAFKADKLQLARRRMIGTQLVKPSCAGTAGLNRGRKVCRGHIDGIDVGHEPAVAFGFFGDRLPLGIGKEVFPGFLTGFAAGIGEQIDGLVLGVRFGKPIADVGNAVVLKNLESVIAETSQQVVQLARSGVVGPHFEKPRLRLFSPSCEGTQLQSGD